MSTRSVPLAELAPVARGEVRDDALVVRTTGIWKSRLDPTSKLRLFNRERQSTGWLPADALHVSDGWIYVPATVDLLDHAEQIRMTGLSARRARGPHRLAPGRRRHRAGDRS